MNKPTKRFVIRYNDESDKGCPVFDWSCFADDSEHAEMKFLECNGDAGWKVLSVDRPRTPHGKVNEQFDREAA